jgi:hypothetical protein
MSTHELLREARFLKVSLNLYRLFLKVQNAQITCQLTLLEVEVSQQEAQQAIASLSPSLARQVNQEQRECQAALGLREFYTALANLDMSLPIIDPLQKLKI